MCWMTLRIASLNTLDAEDIPKFSLLYVIKSYMGWKGGDVSWVFIQF